MVDLFNNHQTVGFDNHPYYIYDCECVWFYNMELSKSWRKKMNLVELDELCFALEDKGLYREAQVLHEKFVKESQSLMEQTSTPQSFSNMLKEFAPTFVRLLAVAPTRVKGQSIPTFAADESSDTISLVQDLLMKSPYLKDKTGLKVNGIAGPNTLRIMGDLKRILNKILFDSFAIKFNIKDKTGKILIIENFKSF